MENIEKLYTIKEVADLLRVSKPTVYHWFNTGQLRYVWVGVHRRVPESAIKQFVRPGMSNEGDDSPGQQSARVAA